MNRINFELNLSEEYLAKELKFVTLKRAFPFYFTVSNNIGTLSFLCYTDKNEPIIIHCNYNVSDSDMVCLRSFCKYYKKSFVDKLVFGECIKSSDNFITDLNLSRTIEANTNYFVAEKLDSDGKQTDIAYGFEVDHKLISIFSVADNYITNCGIMGLEELDYMNQTFPIEDNITFHLIDSESVSIYKIASWTRSNKKDVVAWLKVKDSRLNKEYNIICRFLLDNDYDKHKLKNVLSTKKAMEAEYINNKFDNVYIINCTIDSDLFEEENYWLMISNKSNMFALSLTAREKLLEMIEK